MATIPDLPSPCTGVCKIEDETNLCGGCLRTREEIKSWGHSSNENKYSILKLLKLRRIERGQVSESDLRPRRRRSKK